VYALDVGGDAAVDAEELAVDDGGEGEVVEEVHHCVVDLLVVLGETCVGGAVHSERKLKKEVSCRHSWLPRSMYTVSLNFSLIARMRPRTSKEKQPRST
jgi:hypothetical protein